MMTISAWRAVAVAVLCASPVAHSSAERDWRGAQDTWWNDAELVKDAIVAGAALKAMTPDLAQDKRATDHFWRLSTVLLLFDSMSSQKSLAMLASLSPYYLGEAPDEIYSCLVQRKGKRIAPFLRKLAESKIANECLQRFGMPREPGQTGRRLCLDTDEHRLRLQELLARIDRDQPCTIEK